MKSMQKGFTLIELMIVVAIIAILAAIAIPQYQTYVVKSQVTRAIAEASDMKVTIEDCLNNNAINVAAAAANQNNCDPSATGSDILTGATQGSTVLATNTGVPQIAPVAMDATADITITASFGNHASATLVSNNYTVTLTRTPAGSWTCATTAPNKYAPASCPGT